jgi:hypothetical protein
MQVIFYPGLMVINASNPVKLLHGLVKHVCRVLGMVQVVPLKLILPIGKNNRRNYCCLA